MNNTYNVHDNIDKNGKYVYMGVDADNGADMFSDLSNPSQPVYSRLDDKERAFIKDGDEYRIPEINKFENGRHIVIGMNGGLIKTFCAEDGKDYIFDKSAFGADAFKIKANEPFEIIKTPNNNIELKFDKVFDMNKNEDIEASFRRMGFSPIESIPCRMNDLINTSGNAKSPLNFNDKNDLKINELTPNLNIFGDKDSVGVHKNLEKSETGKAFKEFTAVELNGKTHIPQKSTNDEYYVFDKTDKYVVFGKVKPAVENGKPAVEYFKADLNDNNMSNTLKYQMKSLKKLDMVNFQTGNVTRNYADVNAKRIFADAYSNNYKKLYKLEKSAKNLNMIKSKAEQIKSMSVSFQNFMNNVKHDHLQKWTNAGNGLRI
jgi:hypothetical protein